MSSWPKIKKRIVATATTAAVPIKYPAVPDMPAKEVSDLLTT
jgi:hypothetical protein